LAAPGGSISDHRDAVRQPGQRWRDRAHGRWCALARENVAAFRAQQNEPIGGSKSRRGFQVVATDHQQNTRQWSRLLALKGLTRSWLQARPGDEGSEKKRIWGSSSKECGRPLAERWQTANERHTLGRLPAGEFRLMGPGRANLVVSRRLGGPGRTTSDDRR